MKRLILASALGTLLFAGACADGRVKSVDDWNRTEKGAAIGGASGAVLGGLVGSQSGNTGTGAVIGGLAGAGGLIGNEIDDNDHDDWRDHRRHR